MRRGGTDLDITFEAVKDFLHSVVELMLLFNSGASQFLHKSTQQQTSKMQFAIAHCCKLILNQFMTDKSMMRSSETHRLLQESLLDIVVERLERLCGLKKSSKVVSEDTPAKKVRPPGYKLNRISS